MIKIENKMIRLFTSIIMIAVLVGCKSLIEEPLIPSKKVFITYPEGGEIFKDSITIKGRIINFDENPAVEILANKSIVGKIYSVDSTFSAVYLIPKSGDTTTYEISAKAVLANSIYLSNSVTVRGISYNNPVNLTLKPGTESFVHLYWEKNFEEFDSYIVERKDENNEFTQIGVADTTEFYDYDVDPLQVYSYRVRGVKNSIITSPSNELTVATITDDIVELLSGPELPVDFIRSFIHLKASGMYAFLNSSNLFVVDSSGSLVEQKQYKPFNIDAIAYSSAKNIFITYDSTRFIDIWDANAITIIDSFYFGTTLKGLELSVTGDTLYAISDFGISISVYDLVARRPIQVLTKKGEEVFQSVKLLPGRIFAAAERRQYVNFYFLNNNFDHQWLDFGNKYIGEIAFSPDGNEMLVTSTNELYFTTTDYSDLRITKTINLNEASAVNSAFYLPGNKTLALVGNVLIIYSLVDNEILVLKEINSLFSIIDREAMKLIIPQSNRFTFYKLKRHWRRIN